MSETNYKACRLFLGVEYSWKWPIGNGKWPDSVMHALRRGSPLLSCHHLTYAEFVWVCTHGVGNLRLHRLHFAAIITSPNFKQDVTEQVHQVYYQLVAESSDGLKKV